MPKRMVSAELTGRLLDWIIVPCLIFVCLYNPGHTDGLLLHLEAGQYLGAINALFFHQIPYRDFFVLYGPLSVLVPGWLMKFQQPTLEVLRTYFHIGSILTIIIGYFVARTVLRTRGFSYLAALVLVKEAFHPFMSSRWGGLRMGVGLLIVLILFRSMGCKRNTAANILAGFFCGLAVLFSTEIGLAALLASVVFMVAAMKGSETTARIGSHPFLYLAGGWLLAIVPFFAYLALEGALGVYIRTAFWEIPLNHVRAFGQGHVPLPYPETMGMESVYDWIFGLGLKTWLPLIVYGSGIFYVACARESTTFRGLKVYLITLCCFGVPLYIAAFRAVTQPQFSSSIIPAIIVGMLFLESIWLRLVTVYRAESTSWNHDNGGLAGEMIAPSSSTGCRPASTLAERLLVLRASLSPKNLTSGQSQHAMRVVFYGGILTAGLCYVLCSVGASGPTQGSLFSLLDPGREAARGMQELDLRRAGHVQLPRWQATEIKALIDDVVTRTSADEPIFVFPDMASYYFLAERRSVGRFPVALLAALKPNYRKELLRCLEDSPPRYILYDEGNSSLATGVYKTDRDMLPEVYEFIWSRYRVLKRYGSTLLLHLDRPSNQPEPSVEPAKEGARS